MLQSKLCVKNMHKVVFDSVVFVRSLINPRSIWGNLVFEAFLNYRLYISQEIAIEILEVIQRPEIKVKFHSLPGRDINIILEIISQAEVVEVIDIPQISREIKDDKFLATAEVAEADYLVSEDQDLLILKEYAGTKIVNTTTFLKILSQKNQ